MRDGEFRDWLSRRSPPGVLLTDKGGRNRMGKARRIKRALTELGFEESDLDEVYAAGRWNELLIAMSQLRSDWRNNVAAARTIAPQSEHPSGQRRTLVRRSDSMAALRTVTIPISTMERARATTR